MAAASKGLRRRLILREAARQTDWRRTRVRPRFATPGPAAAINAAIRESGEATVEVWLTPADATQAGPARAITISKDSGARNVTLGQDGGAWVVRFRTDKTSPNGEPALAGGAVKPGAETHLVYTFGGGVARLYQDGKLAAEKQIGGSPSNWEAGFRLGFGDEFTGERRWEAAIGLRHSTVARCPRRRSPRTPKPVGGHPRRAFVGGNRAAAHRGGAVEARRLARGSREAGGGKSVRRFRRCRACRTFASRRSCACSTAAMRRSRSAKSRPPGSPRCAASRTSGWRRTRRRRSAARSSPPG
ncbi:MAG: LamG domain-containing protein [Verrucomicrobiales bacterium]